ncbi:MAG: amidoligase family protein [Hespellia sp.]|nr:amidoligase family protein [Hespellia sp.]
MNDMIKKQRFGVEIEMTGLSRANAAEVVARELNSRVYDHIGSYDARLIKDSQGRTWKIVSDASIDTHGNGGSYAVEFVTPPLNYEDIETLQNIVRKLKEAGAKRDNSCGIHVHVDGANHTPASLRRLVNFMTARQDLIYESLEIGARANRWCRKLNQNLLKEMKKDKNLSKTSMEQIWYSPANDNYTDGIDHQHYNSTRYHGVNLHSFFTKGTVEFRLFNSTLHAGKIKAYIQFCLAVSAWAITSEDKLVFRSTAGYTAEQKVTLMRNILTHRLGLYGEEFKTCRLHLMNPLKKTAGMTVRDAA